MSEVWEALKSFYTQTLEPASFDFMRSLPDSLLFGISVFALTTQSWPLGALVLAMLEFTLIHRIFGGFVNLVGGGDAETKDLKCLAGLPSPYQISLVGTLIQETAFPSGYIFFVTAVLGYTLSSTFNVQKELEELGKKEQEWKSRLPLSVFFSCAFLALVVVWRVLLECDSVGAGLFSCLLGLFFGFLIFNLHVYLFGRESVNFLGIPLLADRAAKGRPLHVCAPQLEVLKAELALKQE